jgi:adenylate kinase family enzyme
MGQALGLPVTHLDGVYYDPDWKPLPQGEFAALQEALVAGERWVIEGNYVSTLPVRLAAADTVIFLDLPPTVCLWGIVQRRWRYKGGQHPEEGVFDRITLGFVRYVWRYRKTMRPRVMALADGHSGLIVLRSRKAINEFAGGLQACHVSGRADSRAVG